MIWRVDDPQDHEAEKIKYDVVPYTRGTVLDLGAGSTRLYQHWITVDNATGCNSDLKPAINADCAHLTETVNAGSVDAVFSSHLLQHLLDYCAALKDWWTCLKPGGYLVLYLPHKDLYQSDLYQHQFYPVDIIEAMASFAEGFDLVVNETRDEGDEYSFLQVYRTPRRGP